MQNFLQGQKLWKHVSGKTGSPDALKMKYDDWEADVGKINSSIANS